MVADKQSALLWGVRVALLSLACLLFAGARSSVAAAPTAEPLPSESIAIIKLPFAGIAGEVESDLKELLRGTLNRHGFNVLTSQVVQNRLANEPRLFACSTISCYGRLAQVLGVRRIVEGEVQRLELSTFAMRLSLRDLYSGKLVAPPVQERCDVCSSEDVRAMVVRAAEVLSQIAPPKGPQETSRPSESGMLSLESDPAGARILIDRVERAERTPATLLLGAGMHDLVIDGGGYEPKHAKVEIIAGQQTSLSYELMPKPQRRPWLRPLAWTTAILAVGLAVGSGVLFYYDGKPVITDDCPPLSGAFHCPQKYDNRTVGIAAAVGAGVLAIGSGLAFYFDSAAPRRRPIAEAEAEADADKAANPAPSTTGSPTQGAPPGGAPPPNTPQTPAAPSAPPAPASSPTAPPPVRSATP